MTNERKTEEELNAVVEVVREAYTPQPKTVRVRVAVAMDREGNWAAAGYSDSTDEISSGTAIDCGPGESVQWHTHFIEATLPIPTEETVEAEVVE